ncbi:MAG TPA: translocation/assembly module TamB domain-containing protein, partial [Opitutaceae bacterium]|nr:translocation/assembly module TamB domain-containing protein [Opitutaceae bacterium]
VAAELRRWLPRATLRAGTVQWPGGHVEVAGVEWRAGRLAATGGQWLGHSFDATVQPAAVWSIAVRSAAPERTWGAQLQWTGPQVDGAIAVGLQPFRVQARFGEHGWVPEAAEANLDRWTIAAGPIGLGAQYSRIQTSGRVSWKESRLLVNLEANAVPAPGVKAPPLAGQVEAHADRTALTVTQLHLEAPFASADLSEPLQVVFGRHGAVSPAKLKFSADLGRLPWVEAQGRLQGELTTIGPATEPSPATFRFSADDLAWHGVGVRAVAAAGELRWPVLRFDTLTLDLDAADRLTGSGGVDLVARSLRDVVLHAEAATTARVLAAAPELVRWLPDGLEWSAATLDAAVAGPLAAPEYQGTAVFKQARWARLRAMDLNIRWSGRGTSVPELDVDASAGAGTLRLTGAVDEDGATVRELHFERNGAATWRLTAPARVQWAPALAVERVTLEGPAGGRLNVALVPGAQASVQVDAQQIDPGDWRDWIALPGPAWRLDQLQAEGHLTDGKAVYTAHLAGTVQAGERTVAVRLAADGDGRGLRLAGLELAEQGHLIVRAGGTIPVWWDAREARHWQFDPTAPIEFTADTQPDAAFWEALAAQLGVAADNPEAHLVIHGSLDRPEGELRLAVRRLTGRAPWSLPAVADLTACLHADGRVVNLDALSATIEGQPVTATGRLPLPAAGWLRRGRKPVAIDWRTASGRIDLPEIDLAQLARRRPDLPLVRGRLAAQLVLEPGGKLSGEVRLADASSVPLGLTGVVQNINGELALAGRRAEVRSLSGEIGGETVRVTGWVEWPAGAPRMDLTLAGSNLPLVRSAGLLVRSDVALQAATDRAGLTRVTGAVTLRDCLVLRDITALLPTGQRGVTPQPPFFAVPVAPFDRWPLAVRVRGPQSVKIQTTVFAGTASPRFDLGGTLGEPRAVGELTVDQGQVFFPFATFNVQLGTLRLPEADPYHAQLNLSAVSVRPDYELRLAVTGNPLAPDVALSSNPPLESSQLLLLVTTGQPPAAEGTGNVSAQQRLAGIGAYLGKGLLGGLGGGGPGRLTVISGNQLSEQGKATYEVDYRLAERWTLVGEYDQFDDYNAGLKYRLYEKGGGHAAK